MTTNDLSGGKLSEKNISNVKEYQELKRLQVQMTHLQLDIDLLRETLNVLIKDPGVILKALNNREKTAIDN